jgi:DNA-binding SARP family transcriptional activator
MSDNDRDTAVRLLGPIEVKGPSGLAVFAGSRQRTIVGLLAINATRLVARTTLIDALWGADPPRTAVKTLHSHIARVRQALDDCGLPGVLTTCEPGYRLELAPTAVDAHRFEERVAAGRRALADGHHAVAARALREGLALWRGEPFADAPPDGDAAAETARLVRLRTDAWADLWDAELRQGRHLAALPDLERAAAAHPTSERLAGLLMLAQYRSGRPSEASDTYRRLRAHLADEHGTEPGPDLRRLHVGMLRREPDLDAPGPATGAVPAQLPAPAGHFTGRAAELARLDRLRDSGHRVILIRGAAGMGKTTLAVWWAHRLAGAYPDGHLFLDLRGDAPAGAPGADDVLAQALAALGVPTDRVPAGRPARTGLYRTVAAGRRLLVVADNVGDAEQIQALVPPGDAALLVATARRELPGLDRDHAIGSLEVDALHPDEALALLARLLGPTRTDEEPVAARELVDHCGRMPLALRIAAAKLAARPDRPIRDLAAELGGGRALTALSGPDRPAADGGVRAAFTSAYEMLDATAARAFRVVGLHPGATVTAPLIAAATGRGRDEAAASVADLAAAHLLTEAAPDRYSSHDLIRAYAVERARSDEPPAARREMVERLLDWYLVIAATANRLIDRGRDRVTPVPRHPPAEPPFAGTAASALAFLDAERSNLVPVVRYAAERGHPTTAWQLTYLLTGYFDSRGHWGDRVELCRWGVTAAAATGPVDVEGLMRSGLGVAYIMTRRFDEALAELGRALALLRVGGDRHGEAHVHNNIAVAYARMRRPEKAIGSYHRALTLHTELGADIGVALALSNIGDAYVSLGRPDLGVEHLTRSLALSRRIGNARLEAAALGGLGQAHLAAGDPSAAVAAFGECLTVRRRTGDRRSEADTLYHLGLGHLRCGDAATAIDQLRPALSLSQEVADPHLEAQVLRGLGRAHLDAGDLTAARGYLHLALVVRIRVPDEQEAATIHSDLSELAARAGEPIDATST